MTDINELLAKAQATGINTRAEGEYYEPAEGDFVVEVKDVRTGVTQKSQQPRISVWVEIVDESHPDSGERWWDSIILGGSDAANAINFGKLKGLGAEEDQIAALGTVEAIAQFLKGNTAKATVKHNADKSDPSKVYVNTYFSRDVESGRFAGKPAVAAAAEESSPAPAEVAASGW